MMCGVAVMICAVMRRPLHHNLFHTYRVMLCCSAPLLHVWRPACSRKIRLASLH